MLAGLGLSAVGIVAIARVVNPDRLSLTLGSIQWAWIGGALLATLATYGARTKRWIILLHPLKYRTAAVLRALLTGQLLNHLLPIRLGDVIRALLLAREPGSTFARVFGSLLIEKAWDWLALCVLIMIVAWAIPLPDWLLIPARSIGLLAALILIGFVGVILIPERWISQGLARLDRALAKWPARWRSFTIHNLRRLLDSLAVLRRRDTLIGAAVWTTITWGLGIVLNYAVQRAFGFDSWLAAAALLVVLMLGVALPPSIAAIGVFEGLSMLTLSTFGVPLETALAIGLLLHLVVTVPLVIGTAVLWLSAGRKH
jgi:uncharacterized protein (TIRG00374 family)